MRRSRLLLLALLGLAACSQRDKKPRLPAERILGTWRGAGITLVVTADGMVQRSDSSTVPATTTAGTWDGADSLLRVVVQPTSPGAVPRLESLLYIIHPDTLIRSNDARERLVRQRR